MVGFWVASVGIRRFHFSKLKASSSRCNLLRGQSSHDSQGRSGQKRKTSRLSSLLRCVVRGKGEIGILNGPFYIILVHFRSRLRMNHSRFNFGSRLKVETSRGDPVRGWMVFREGNFSPVTSYGIFSDRCKRQPNMWDIKQTTVFLFRMVLRISTRIGKTTTRGRIFRRIKRCKSFPIFQPNLLWWKLSIVSCAPPSLVGKYLSWRGFLRQEDISGGH